MWPKAVDFLAEKKIAPNVRKKVGKRVNLHFWKARQKLKTAGGHLGSLSSHTRVTRIMSSQHFNFKDHYLEKRTKIFEYGSHTPYFIRQCPKEKFFLRMSSLSRPFEIRVSPICFPTLPISWFVNQVRWKQPEPIIEAVAIGKFLQLGKFWLLAPNWWDTSKLPTLVTSLFIVWIKSKSSNQQLGHQGF